MSSKRLDAPATTEACIRIQRDGRLLRIQRQSRPQDDDHDGLDADGPSVKRGNITGFSEASRRRLRRTVHAVRRGAEALFVTLTYHETRPSPDECKNDLDVFIRRLRRAFPDIGIVWKMEPQERGVPHFHMFVYGVPYIPAKWLSKTWHDITDETSRQHRKSGVDIERDVNEDGKLQVYLSKYMTKEYDGWPGSDERWHETGRWWGVRYPEAIPWAHWEDWAVYIDTGDATQLILDLLHEWGVDLDVIPSSLTVCCRGRPEDRMRKMLSRLGHAPPFDRR